MYLPDTYLQHPIWLTIDVERVEDANFGITPKKELSIDYPAILDKWDTLTLRYGFRSTAFVLGSFARRFPHVIKNLHQKGHEIASHGYDHQLVYQKPFDVWKKETALAKKILEEIIEAPVLGYRSPSWSLPFKKRYYEALVEIGFAYSSSYFPFKTYMYGNAIDKKNPFVITTPSGEITEIPIPKCFIPFSGGFYMRMLPLFVTKRLFSCVTNRKIKPIIYTHPYELLPNLLSRFLSQVRLDKAYILTFANTGESIKRFDSILQEYTKGKV